jgi:asparagine synthase (glutamine-hydrolysing)
LLGQSEASRFQSLRSFLDSRDRDVLYHDEFRRRLAPGPGAEEYLQGLYDSTLSSDYDRSFSADFLSYLPEDLLVKVDRASMAHGLECRSPFLDQELVEFASRIPPEWKIHGRQTKRILKDAVEEWFPAGFLDRPKMGFSVPIGKWFRGELRQFVDHHLLHGPLRRLPLLKMSRVESLLDEHFSHAREHETLIWNLQMLSLWLQEYDCVA